MTSRALPHNRVLIAALLLAVAACSSESPESLLASARTYLENKDDRAAIIQIKNALQAKPEFPEARYLLGKTLLLHGDAATAEIELRRALQLGHPAGQTVPLLAQSLLLQRQEAKLIVEFGSFQAKSPDEDASVQTTLAIAYDSIGNRAAAEKAIAAALNARIDHAPALLVKARILGAGGSITEALAVVDSVLAANSSDANALKLRGDLLMAHGEKDSALDAYRKAVAAKPEQIAAQGALVSLLIERRAFDEAQQHIAALRQVTPKHPLVSQLEARLALAQNDLPKARERIQSALKLAPDDAPSLYLAAVIEFQAQAYAQVEVYLGRLLRLYPDAQGAHRLLAVSYLRSNQPQRSLQVLRPILAQGSPDAEMLALAGEAAMQQGDFAEAERFFQSASSLDPQDVTKRTALALLRVNRGNEVGFADLERIAAGDSGMQADLALVAASVERKQYDRALKAIERLEAKQPNDPRTHYLRGAVLFDRRDGDAARRSLERALDIDPGYIPAAVSLAKLDLLDARPDSARQRFAAILQRDEKNQAALLALAEIEMRAGSDSNTVATLLERAISANPAAAGPRLALIELHLRNRNATKAQEVAQQAVAANDGQPEYLDALGRTQLAAGDTQNALASFSRLADSQPNSPLPLLRLAETHLIAKDGERAIAALEKALSIKADYVDAQRLLTEIHASRGASERAVTIARNVQQQRPREDTGYLMEGSVRAVGKDWSAAAIAYKGGLSKAPSTELAIRLHGVLTASGKADDAQRHAESWLSAHPRDARFRMFLGDQAISARKLDLAASHYSRVIELQPGNAVALNNLAWVALQRKDPAALRHAERANRLVPGNPAFMDTWAMALLERGDSSRAIDLLKQATARAPQAMDIRVNLVRALARSGDRSAAKREFDALSALGDRGPGPAVLEKLASEI